MRNSKYSGFTIVELLVVIVVIGVLASIALVSYTGISKKATIATITSDLDNAYKKFKLYQIENSGYPNPSDIELGCTTPSSTTKICLKPSPNNQYTLTTVDNSISSNQKFCLTVLNVSLNTKYRITSEGTQAEGECPYTLTASGTNGTVTGGGEYAPNATATITATGNSGYLFSSWSGDAGCVGDGTSSHTIVMDANKTCTANFILVYTLTVNYGAGGTATGGGTFVSGSSRTITANPIPIATFSGWTGAGCSSGTVLMDANKTCMANFTIDTTNWYTGIGSLAGKYVYKADSPGTYEFNTSVGCAVGGRWPTYDELVAIWTNRSSYGNFQAYNYYWSSTEYYPGFAYLLWIEDGSQYTSLEEPSNHLRCVAG